MAGCLHHHDLNDVWNVRTYVCHQIACIMMTTKMTRNIRIKDKWRRHCNYVNEWETNPSCEKWAQSSSTCMDCYKIKFMRELHQNGSQKSAPTFKHKVNGARKHGIVEWSVTGFGTIRQEEGSKQQEIIQAIVKQRNCQKKKWAHPHFHKQCWRSVLYLNMRIISISEKQDLSVAGMSWGASIWQS